MPRIKINTDSVTHTVNTQAFPFAVLNNKLLQSPHRRERGFLFSCLDHQDCQTISTSPSVCVCVGGGWLPGYMNLGFSLNWNPSRSICPRNDGKHFTVVLILTWILSSYLLMFDCVRYLMYVFIQYYYYYSHENVFFVSYYLFLRSQA